MNSQEYLQGLVAKYNTNPNDNSLSEIEKTLLSKVSEVEKRVSALLQQAGELEKEINIKTQNLVELRSLMVREKGKSDAFVEALLALKV